VVAVADVSVLLSCGQSRSLEESEEAAVLDELPLVVADFELEAASACPTPKAPPNNMAPVRLAPTTTLRIFGARIVITSSRFPVGNVGDRRPDLSGTTLGRRCEDA
jgi:hypothetical protein